ncbi:hypothetical protein QTP86_034560, partial [Hemibagrus guttatus]
PPLAVSRLSLSQVFCHNALYFSSLFRSLRFLIKSPLEQRPEFCHSEARKHALCHQIRSGDEPTAASDRSGAQALSQRAHQRPLRSCDHWWNPRKAPPTKPLVPPTESLQEAWSLGKSEKEVWPVGKSEKEAWFLCK